MVKDKFERFVDTRHTYLIFNPDGTPIMGRDPVTMKVVQMTGRFSVAEHDRLIREGVYKLEIVDSRIDAMNERKDIS